MRWTRDSMWWSSPKLGSTLAAPSRSFCFAVSAAVRTPGEECSRHFVRTGSNAAMYGAMSEGFLTRAQTLPEERAA